MTVRLANRSDQTAVSAVHRKAFGLEEGPVIAELVTAMLADPSASPLLSLVHLTDDVIAAHILFSRVSVIAQDGDVSARILSPLAVRPEFQRRGMGKALILDGFDRLSRSEVDLVFVLGDPSYYARFDFRPASPLGLEAPHPIPTEHSDAWQVKELRPGLLGTIAGRVECSDELGKRRYWV